MKYKYNRINVECITNALNEYENTTITHNEVCLKYGINVNSFFYHLRKHRMNKQNGGYSNISTNAQNENILINGDRMVSLDTNNKKMNAYMKQHNMKPSSDAVSEQISELKKDHHNKKLDHDDLNKIFEGYV